MRGRANLIIAALSAAAFFWPLPDAILPAAAQQGFAWTAGRSDDGWFIMYGVPETDNVQFSAVCRGGKGRVVPVASISASLEGFADKAPVSLAISGPGFRHVMDGVVELSQSEEAPNVVVVEAPLDDLLWQALSSQPSLFYSVDGGERIAIGLRGSSRAVGRFLDGCGAIANGAVASKPNNAQPSTAELSCKSARNAKSNRSEVPVSVTFVNQTGSYRSVMWIGFDGQPVNYANLDPGQQFTINTFVGHPWMFTDGPGNCAEMFMPQPGIAVFNITAPDPEGGD